MKKKLCIALASVIVIIAAALALVGNYLVNYAIVRSDVQRAVAPESVVTAENESVAQANRAVIREKQQAWLAETTVEKKSIVSDDGLTLAGEIYWNDPESHKWLLGIHGYTSCKEDYQKIACLDRKSVV